MTSSDSRSSVRRRLLPVVLIPVLALIALTTWALSSPVASAPDDSFHLASIWCGHGDAEGICEPSGDSGSRLIPEDLVDDAYCFVAGPETSAACQGKSFGDTTKLDDTSLGNFSGLYPPVFYGAMSVFASPNIEVSVLAMRIANSVLFVALATAVFLLLPKHRRSTMLWSMAVTAVPLTFFLIPSTNPSTWGLISASVLWIALLGFYESSGRRKVGLGIVTSIAALMGAGARADSAVYVGVAIVAVVILKASKARSFVLSSILPFILALVAVAFFLSARQSGAASTGLGDYNSGPVDYGDLVSDVLSNVPQLWVGAFGQWPLGWIDTGLPAVVWVASFSCFIAAVFVGIGRRDRRKNIALLLVLAVAWLFPAVLLVQSRATVGQGVQPRYLLPLLIILAGIALLHSEANPFLPSRAQLTLVIGALSAANSVSLHANIRRYVTGIDVNGWNLDNNVEWWWNIAVSPMGVWVLGTAAFTALLVVIALPHWKIAGMLPRDSSTVLARPVAL
jgi:hypothetical protein